jgi:hypothetical protein
MALANVGGSNEHPRKLRRDPLGIGDSQCLEQPSIQQPTTQQHRPIRRFAAHNTHNNALVISGRHDGLAFFFCELAGTFTQCPMYGRHSKTPRLSLYNFGSGSRIGILNWPSKFHARCSSSPPHDDPHVLHPCEGSAVHFIQRGRPSCFQYPLP